MTPLTTFREFFPLRFCTADGDELRYNLAHIGYPGLWEKVAEGMVKRLGLPLVVAAEIYVSRGIVTNMELVVKGVPEETDFIHSDFGDDHFKTEI